MAATAEVAHRYNTSLADGHEHSASRVVPIPTPSIQMSVSAPSPGDPMDVSTSPTRSAAPRNGPQGLPVIDEPRNENSATNSGPGNSSAGPSQANGSSNSGPGNSSNNNNSNSMPAPPSASAAANQPKVVQTAFIHKLYSMLEDSSLQHLISWSSSADSFVMSPSNDFSKALSHYFKHTNISSFVRQLNMYGFHKVSDVFHSTSPDSTLWEFKHGQGCFKRGDLASLRDIKRRASRHSLVHREMNSQKAPPPIPHGMPEQPIPMAPEAADHRIDHAFYDINARLHRQEEMTWNLQKRQTALMSSMCQILDLSRSLTQTVTHLVPPENPVHHEVASIREEMARQIDHIRSLEDPHIVAHHPLPPMAPHDPYAQHRSPYYDNGQVSPHHPPEADPRRANLAVPPQHRPGGQYRPAVPSSLGNSIARRGYGSIGASPTQTSPNSHPPLPPPPTGPHPLSQMDMGRRHTTADIRAHGWQANGAPPPPGYQAHTSSHPPPQVAHPGQWPHSPNRNSHEDQKLCESFSSYSLQSSHPALPRSRPATPPPSAPYDNGPGGPPAPGQSGVTFNNFSWGGRENKNLGFRDSSVPPTRRTSVAHMLNPTNEGEVRDDEDPRGDDDRKRKRLQ